jgi:rhamnosyltransferase
MIKPISKKDICAIVISYHPELNISDKISQLAKQVDRVVIIDNGSTSTELVSLIEISKHSSQIHLILNEENIGQAKALNMGVRYAKEHKYDWILTMDQDSLVSHMMIDNMAFAYQQCHETDQIVSICPVLASYDGVSPPSDDRLHLRSYSGKAIEGLYSPIKIVITSGNLVNVEVFDRVGLFEECFFIDYVDQEFSLRLFQAGYKIIQANKAILYHNLGNTTQHFFLGKQLLVGNNSSLRVYYFYRNGLAVYKKYLFSDFTWVAEDFIRGFVFNLAKIILFESERKDKLTKVMTGLFHGLIGKTGKCTSL